MKKYPVYYEGNTYEVRWKTVETMYSFEDCLRVYQVKEHKLFGIKFKLYKHLCSYIEEDIDDSLLKLGVDKNSEDWHIHQATLVVQKASGILHSINLKNIRKEKLKSWDGIITK